MFKKLFYAGTQPHYSESLNEKIVLTNQVAIALCVIPPVFLAVAWIYMPVLSFLPIASLIILTGSVALNHFGFHTLPRILVSIMPTVCAGTFYVAASQNENEVFLGFYLMIYSFFTLPFLFFELEDTWELVFTIGVCAVFNIGLPYWNELITFDVDSSILSSSVINTISVVLAVGVVSLSMVIFKLIEGKNNNKVQKLLDESELKNKGIEKTNQEMNALLKEMELARKDAEMRNKIATTTSDFNALIRQNQGREEAFDWMISFLVKSVNASQGGIYLFNKKTESLSLKACYAYNRKKHVEKTIRSGEGLLGACFLEKDIIYLKEIPKEYLNITSGLGEAPPRNLIIVPMIYNENCEGVIEIASFYLFSDYDKDLLLKCGEILAANVFSDNINRETRMLLEQSQKQAEDLRAREEELRQAMEEMEASRENYERLSN
ncbi:methyl-accepting chemotaxis protein [Flexibacter flexilis DSM 6793]|uniref:Methyl-accepting chemotaxis protein n=1 Tax=Flexibacter flexilis DSM 6793 TaxID=927664 RepID=A0A1I1DIG4_9BACT|nr:GAF domain-containing protein [Flexibacter flexilis]SFB72858.1 methyl-accepting chemotaxis protein [Flexibacter flexilis DSM 6793]